MKAKTLALLLKIVGAVVIVIGVVYHTIANSTLPSTDQAWGLGIIGICIAGLSTPIDISKIIETSKGVKDA